MTTPFVVNCQVNTISIQTLIIELQTDRLRLRQWALEDREPFARLNADARVMRHFPRPLTRKESDALANRIECRIRERGWGFWAVETKALGQFVGFVGLEVPIHDFPFSPCVEVGWRLAFEYWSHGYATEAALAALRVAFNELGLQEIVSFTSLSNVRSRAVMQRIGMHESGTFDHPALPPDHPLRPHVLYRASTNDWQPTATACDSQR